MVREVIQHAECLALPTLTAYTEAASPQRVRATLCFAKSRRPALISAHEKKGKRSGTSYWLAILSRLHS
jgi:hypothetical protein